MTIRAPVPALKRSLRVALSAEEVRRLNAEAARLGLTKTEHVTRVLRASLPGEA